MSRGLGLFSACLLALLATALSSCQGPAGYEPIPRIWPSAPAGLAPAEEPDDAVTRARMHAPSIFAFMGLGSSTRGYEPQRPDTDLDCGPRDHPLRPEVFVLAAEEPLAISPYRTGAIGPISRLLFRYQDGTWAYTRDLLATGFGTDGSETVSLQDLRSRLRLQAGKTWVNASDNIAWSTDRQFFLKPHDPVEAARTGYVLHADFSKGLDGPFVPIHTLPPTFRDATEWRLPGTRSTPGVASRRDPRASDGRRGRSGSNGQAGREGIDGRDAGNALGSSSRFHGNASMDGQDGEGGGDGQDGSPGSGGSDGAPGLDGPDAQPLTVSIQPLESPFFGQPLVRIDISEASSEVVLATWVIEWEQAFSVIAPGNAGGDGGDGGNGGHGGDGGQGGKGGSGGDGGNGRDGERGKDGRRGKDGHKLSASSRDADGQDGWRGGDGLSGENGGNGGDGGRGGNGGRGGKAGNGGNGGRGGNGGKGADITVTIEGTQEFIDMVANAITYDVSGGSPGAGGKPGRGGRGGLGGQGGGPGSGGDGGRGGKGGPGGDGGAGGRAGSFLVTDAQGNRAERPGRPGRRGEQGRSGRDGHSGSPGAGSARGADGHEGEHGRDGTEGRAGTPGNTGVVTIVRKVTG